MRMTRQLWIASLLLAACATTGSTGSKGSSAPFQGEAALEKRRNEVLDASKPAMECLKVKAGEDAGKGGYFAVVADASGKLTATSLRWEGPPAVAQCIVDTAAKTAVTPLAGPSVGAMWEFWAPGMQPARQQPPKDIDTKVQSVQGNADSDVDACYQRNMPVDFPADVEVSFYVTADGVIHAPTVVSSNSKDGGYDSCVQDAVGRAKFPTLDIQNPLPLKFKFHRGKVDHL
jgi:hypothetical protein